MEIDRPIYHNDIPATTKHATQPAEASKLGPGLFMTLMYCVVNHHLFFY